jgi:hypothetical protein
MDSRVSGKLPEETIIDLNILFTHLSDSDIIENNKYNLLYAWWAWDKVRYNFGYHKSTSSYFFDEVVALTERPVKEYPPPKDNIHEAVIRAWRRNYLDVTMQCITIKKTAKLSDLTPDQIINELPNLIGKHSSLNANEKYVRIREIWESCMVFKRSVEIAGILIDPAEANLERLLEICDESSETDAIMRGEVLRELGRFQECKAQLSRRFSKGHSKTASFIKKLARREKSCVARIA